MSFECSTENLELRSLLFCVVDNRKLILNQWGHYLQINHLDLNIFFKLSSPIIYMRYMFNIVSLYLFNFDYSFCPVFTFNFGSSHWLNISLDLRVSWRSWCRLLTNGYVRWCEVKDKSLISFSCKMKENLSTSTKINIFYYHRFVIKINILKIIKCEKRTFIFRKM